MHEYKCNWNLNIFAVKITDGSEEQTQLQRILKS